MSEKGLWPYGVAVLDNASSELDAGGGDQRGAAGRRRRMARGAY
jgi:hypothetical protein